MSTLVAIDPVMVRPKAKTSLLPVLVVLFLISYGLLTLLVVEQNRTISSQRILISQLYTDSIQLTAMKRKEAQAHATADAQARSHAQAQAPSVQVAPQSKEKNMRRQLLQKPKGVQDNPDSRRDLNQI